MLTSLRKPTGRLGGGVSKTFNNNDYLHIEKEPFSELVSADSLGTSHCGLLASADCFRENFGGRQPGSPDSTAKMCRQHLQGNEVLRNSPPPTPTTPASIPYPYLCLGPGALVPFREAQGKQLCCCEDQVPRADPSPGGCEMTGWV